MNHTPSYDENNLLSQLAAGSHNAFDDIYNRYFEAVYRNVLKITGDEHMAEDLVQEVFVGLWKSRRNFAEKNEVAGWLFLSSYHKSLNLLKQHARITLTPEVDASFSHLISDDTDPVLRENQLALLMKAIAILPERRRQVFELCRLQGKTYMAVAEELNISVNTVKEHLAKANETIRAYVALHKDEIPVTAFLVLMIASA